MADVVPGLSIPGLALPDMYTMMQWFSTIGYVVLIVAMLGVFAFMAMRGGWFSKYPTEVDIFQVKSGSLQLVDNDKARRRKNKKDGEEYYYFKKRKIKWKPPTFESLVQGKKGKSHLYLKELSQDEFEIIDPRVFITGNIDDYKKVESESLDRFYKNIQDDKADLKWNKQSTWDKLLPILTWVIPIMMIGILIWITVSYGVLPILDRVSGAAGIVNQQLNISTQILDKSITYIDYLTRLLVANGIKVPVNNTVSG